MFIDEWFEPSEYYADLPVGFHQAENFRFGQICWTHAYYSHENLEFWRPQFDPGEPTRTIASKFNIAPKGADAFSRAYPLHAPKLEIDEEFIVLRAKRRPVILLRAAKPWADVDNKGFRGKIQRKRCWVAQIFGLTDVKTGRAEFNPDFVNRVRKMEFPELLFLPRKAGVLQVDSILRLDEFQSVFTPHLDATQFALGEPLCRILREQLQLLIGGAGTSEYTLLREELLAS
jgi:hypothetical protein